MVIIPITKETTLNETEKKTSVNDSHCSCCLKPFFIGRGVECNNCNSRSCRKSCSHWDIDENIWLCLFCHHRRSRLKRSEKWFEIFGGVTFTCELSRNKFSTAKSKFGTARAEHVALNSGLDLAAGGYEERNTMENVRELIEKIVENLVGNVDNTSINRLYSHSAYDRLFNEYSTQLAEALTHLVSSLQSCIASK
ncbi:hypothetical protein PV327_003242 [Microctonus hyperodae]|uniref:FYVE-type zinc finger domain-containing protein n=1 Tax=Microctonus hyperodae TaxID=165561 RepID=A0AA39L0V6_MICHY|nr:hypothetical protein PV327_003242 [Microctonus hyperodae]